MRQPDVRDLGVSGDGQLEAPKGSEPGRESIGDLGAEKEKLLPDLCSSQQGGGDRGQSWEPFSRILKVLEVST